jgi:hypothetical protein
MNAKPGHASYHLVALRIAGDSTKRVNVQAARLMSAFGSKADITSWIEQVRFVPQADIVHTPNTIRCRALGRRLGVVRPFGATKDLTYNSLIAMRSEFNF